MIYNVFSTSIPDEERIPAKIWELLRRNALTLLRD